MTSATDLPVNNCDLSAPCLNRAAPSNNASSSARDQSAVVKKFLGIGRHFIPMASMYAEKINGSSEIWTLYSSR